MEDIGNRGGSMATLKTTLAAGLVAALVSTSAFAPDFSVLLGGTAELQQRVEAEAAQSARAAQAFGSSLSAGDRRGLQGTCTALVANANDATAQRRLQEYLSRYKDDNPQAVLRFCLDPSYRQLQSGLQASVESLRAGRSGEQASAALEETIERQRRTFTTISNIMKTRHDTAKNSIGNVR
jgi:hypothetical protein